MKASDLADLGKLKECELVRFERKGSTLSLLVVGDNEEEETPDHEDDEESSDCCDGLNGHLFRILFEGVKDFSSEGEESDNYKTLEVKSEEHHLALSFDGLNFDGPEAPLSLSFSYESFTVKDEGEIDGPDA